MHQDFENDSWMSPVCTGYPHNQETPHSDALSRVWDKMPHCNFATLESIARRVPGFCVARQHPPNVPDDRRWFAQVIYDPERAAQFCLLFSTREPGAQGSPAEVRLYSMALAQGPEITSCMARFCQLLEADLQNITYR